METTKKITVFGVIPEGINIGLKNSASLLGAIVLYILTIWIPYLNVGTTIAMSTIPIELAKGKIISPTFIFNARYRRLMGEYFLLTGFMSMALSSAFIFFIIPGIVLSIAWTLAMYILLDKEVGPIQALRESNKATYGYKWTIFGTRFIIGLAAGIVATLLSLIPYIGVIFVLVLAVLAIATNIGCETVIYKNLVLDTNENVENKETLNNVISEEGETKK